MPSYSEVTQTPSFSKIDKEFPFTQYLPLHVNSVELHEQSQKPGGIFLSPNRSLRHQQTFFLGRYLPFQRRRYMSALRHPPPENSSRRPLSHTFSKAKPYTEGRCPLRSSAPARKSLSAHVGFHGAPQWSNNFLVWRFPLKNPNDFHTKPHKRFFFL